jgi:integrase/recombinase XerC
MYYRGALSDRNEKELCGLIFENVNLAKTKENNGKGNKERVIPISRKLSDLLKVT